MPEGSMSYEEKGSWVRRPEKERGAVSDWAIGGQE